VPGFLNMPLMGIGSAVAIVTTTETVVATSSPINADNLEQYVSIEGLLDLTVGTAGTTVTLRLRRGTTTAGTLISQLNTWGPFTVTATNRVNFAIGGYDVPGLSGGIQYVLTVAVASATGNSTANSAAIQAITSQAT